MAYNYSSLIDGTVDRLIKRFGGTFAYTFVKKGEYNPTTRAQTDASVSATIRGVLLGPTNNFIAGSVVKSADARMLIDPKGLTEFPRQGDRLTVGAFTYYVSDVSQIMPNGSATAVWLASLKAGAL